MIPQRDTLKNVEQEFTLAGNAIEYYKDHQHLDEKWTVRKEEQINHRLCIIGDRIPCAMYITVHGGFESYVGEDFNTVDRLSYGSILQSSMSELIESHNNNCVVSCHDAYLINYFNNLYGPNDLLSELIALTNIAIINRFLAAREKAKKLYPLVSAYDIITAITMPEFIVKPEIYQEILSESEHLTNSEIMQYIDKDLINRLPTLNDENILQQTYEKMLQILALFKKPNAIISPDKVYGSGNLEDTSEFQKLAALNQKYADGELKPDNSINLQCEAVYGKTFRDYEVEKIQNSDLPYEIKMLSLRKNELADKLNYQLEEEVKKFLTNFIKDYRWYLQNIKPVEFNFDKAIQKVLNKKIHPAVRSIDGLRCWRCCKVIQTVDWRNIHCEETEQGLKCGYCGSVNTLPS